MINDTNNAIASKNKNNSEFTNLSMISDTNNAIAAIKKQLHVYQRFSLNIFYCKIIYSNEVGPQVLTKLVSTRPQHFRHI